MSLKNKFLATIGALSLGTITAVSQANAQGLDAYKEQSIAWAREELAWAQQRPRHSLKNTAYRDYIDADYFQYYEARLYCRAALESAGNPNPTREQEKAECFNGAVDIEDLFSQP